MIRIAMAAIATIFLAVGVLAFAVQQLPAPESTPVVEKADRLVPVQKAVRTIPLAPAPVLAAEPPPPPPQPPVVMPPPAQRTAVPVPRTPRDVCAAHGQRREYYRGRGGWQHWRCVKP